VSTLGAGFLLLAYFFPGYPLVHPILYALAALDLFLLWRKNHSALRGAILVAAALFCGFLFSNGYVLLFSLCLSIIIGKFLVEESFRWWKWIVSSALLYATMGITSTWYQLSAGVYWLPPALSPLLPGAVFAFCFYFSFVVYLLRKDPVEEAFDHYTWEQRSESLQIASQTRDLYQKIKTQLQTPDAEPRVKEELENFAEQTIHLCHRLLEISREVDASDPAAIEEQLQQLQKKAQDVSDPMARKHYEHASASKRRQKEQLDALRMQAERIRSQSIHYVIALENMRFAYTNRQFTNSSVPAGIDYFLQMTQTRTDNIYETSEAYARLLAQQ
jgi:hypothetical protein